MSLEDFDTGLVEYWEIEGEITNKTPIHVGTEGSRTPGETIDNPIIRLPDGTPFIPGSSLKGVLRSLVEAYLRSTIISGDESSACYKFFKEKGITIEKYDKLCSPFPSQSGKLSEDEEKEAREKCINKKLFGGQEIASHIHIYDAYPAEGSDPKTMIKPGVAIDRFLGAAMPSAVYKFEIIQPNVKWKFKMRIYGLILDLKTEEKNDETRCIRETLALILKTLEKGLTVGGKGSTGHGLIKLENADVTHYYFDPGKMDFTAEKQSLDEFIKMITGGSK